jgi:hypothetical protein
MAVVELDFRSVGDIDVTLLWDPERDFVTVQVVDRAEQEDFTVAVPPERAADAFSHPFAYRALPSAKVVVRRHSVALD